jgi:hypothetical protein
MSSSTVLSLAYATQQVNIYLRSFLFVFGLTNNILNIIVFLSLQTFRESSCSFYLTAMSFVNIVQMFLGLLSRTLNVGFGIDWTISSVAYCKARFYIAQVCSLLGFTYMYLATIDQYFATCSNLRWQRLSNIKLARWLVGLFSVVWILHGIPAICFYNDITPITTNQTVCQITDPSFQRYYSYFYLLVLIGIVPVFIIVLFGLLAYRNVQQISYRAVPLVRRETDKQLTVMVLVQDIYNLFFLVPFIVLYIITLNINTSNNPIYMAQLNLASTVTTTLFYVPFCVSIDCLKRFDVILVIFLFRVDFISIFAYRNDFVDNFSLYSARFFPSDVEKLLPEIKYYHKYKTYGLTVSK